MFYLRVCITHCANHRDNIETDIMIHMEIFHIMIDGSLKITQFMIVNSCLRLNKGTIATGLDFNKHHRFFIHSDDINVAMS